MDAPNRGKRRGKRTPNKPAGQRPRKAAKEHREEVQVKLPAVGEIIQILWRVDDESPVPQEEHDPEWAGTEVDSPIAKVGRGLQQEQDGKLTWWFARVVSIDESGEGTIMYSEQSDGNGMDLIQSHNGDNNEGGGVVCRVEFEVSESGAPGARHVEDKGKPVLEWRHALWDSTTTKDDSSPVETRISSVAATELRDLSQRVTELERVVLLHIGQPGTTEAPVNLAVSPRHGVVESSSKSVLRILARNDAYHALSNKDPKLGVGIRSLEDGPIDGSECVVQSVLKTRGVGCTLSQFQSIVSVLLDEFSYETSAGAGSTSGLAAQGRHGRVRLVPSPLRMWYPNTEQDQLGVQMEAYGDLCDALGFADFPRGLFGGKDPDEAPWVFGTTIFCKGDDASSGSGRRPPSRYILPGRTPFSSCKNEKRKSETWEVPVLYQPDSSVKGGDRVSTVFRADTKTSAPEAADPKGLPENPMADQEGTWDGYFGLTWSRVKNHAPKGVEVTDCPGLLQSIFPACLLRSKALRQSAFSVLEAQPVGAQLESETGPSSGTPMSPSIANEVDGSSHEFSARALRPKRIGST